MAHNISALIMKQGVASRLLGANPGLDFLFLPQGFALAKVDYYAMPDEAEFLDLPGKTREFLATMDIAFDNLEGEAVAYLETEYFGGYGSQWAFAFESGKILSGPYFIGDKSFGGARGQAPISEWPINRVLRFLGVEKQESLDEFEALGLENFRSP